MDFSLCNIDIDFDVIDIDGRTMSLCIMTADRHCEYKVLRPGSFSWSDKITLPTKISIRASNRPPHSTLVDDNGSILRNMSVVIKDLRLDGMSCWRYWLDHKLLMVPDDAAVKPVRGRTICENGTIDIDFPDVNAFFWVVKSRFTDLPVDTTDT